MANPYQGLFSGQGVNSLGGVQQAMMREKNQRIANAMAQNAKAGGNYYSNLIAKSNAQLGEAAKGMMQGLAGGSLGNIGGTEEVRDERLAYPIIKPAQEGFLRQALPQDPRLSEAVTRDSDRKELMDKYKDFNKDGVITEQEWDIMISDLSSKGYMSEAAKIQSMKLADVKAQTELLKADNTGNANELGWAKLMHKKKMDKFGIDNPEGTVHKRGTVKDTEGNTFIESSWTPKLGGKKAKSKMFWTPTDPATPDLKPVGKTVLVTSDQGVGASEEAGLAGDRAGAVSQAQADVASDVRWTIEGETYQNQGITARDSIKRIDGALDALEHIERTGGYANLKKNMTDFLGTTDVNVGNFDTITKMQVLSLLGQLGANPTEGERAFLLQASAGIANGSTEVNVALLNRMKAEAKRQQARGDWFVKTKKDKRTRAGFAEWNDKYQIEATTAKPMTNKQATDAFNAATKNK